MSRRRYKDNFPAGKDPGNRFNAERRDAFFAANWEERLKIHNQVAQTKQDAMQARKALAVEYLNENAPGFTIPQETAAVRLDWREKTRAARAEALAMGEGAASQTNNRSLEFPVLGKDFPADSASIQLAMSPAVIAPIAAYFGHLPILFNMFVTRAHLRELLPDSSHRFHIDPEDVLTHKVFINLTDVDDGCGPLHVLESDASQDLLIEIDYRGIDRVEDETVRQKAGWDRVVKFDGPAGTTAFADTSRCLHFGGRPRDEGKPVRYTLVFQYLLPTSYLFPVNGDCAHPRFLPQLDATGEPIWDALTGWTHTDP